MARDTPFDTLGAPYADELAKIRARLALAQALTQTYGRAPQGQMVGQHYVKPAWTQHLAQLTNALSGAKAQADSATQMADLQQRYQKDQSGAVGEMQQLATGGPRELAGPPQEGEQMGTAMVPGNPLAAEQYGQTSQYPQAQALAKTMMEERLKRIAAMQKEMAGRVGVQDIPSVYGGQTQGLQPKQGIQYVEGLPVATPSEYVPGGPTPARIGGGYQQTTVPGYGGQPMAAQQNPLTGKIDVLDKAPRVSATATAGGKEEDPYWKKLLTDLGERDAKKVVVARDAPAVLESIARLRKVHADAKGEWTGGPLKDVVRFIRDTASQFSVPLDPAIDLNNVKMQAEFAGAIAKEILGQGRGLTNEDVVRLEKAYPTDRLTPAQLPAFLNQYEKLVRANAVEGNKLIESAAARKPGMPTALRENTMPAPGSTDDMSLDDMIRRRDELRRKLRPQQ